MNIASLVVHTLPENLEGVYADLEAMPGVEVHGKSEEGKLVVTIEDEGKTLASDSMMAVQDINGVVNAVLIYHYGGEENMLEEETRESH